MTEAERFWAKVLVTPACWLWTAAVDGAGYGAFRRSGSGPLVGAHRWSWEAAHGPITDDLTVDHLCRTTLCVAPQHMELVRREENVRRVSGASETSCPAGHPRPAGTRCHVCNRQSMRRLRASRRLQRVGVER